jgi:hypothetical protein
MNSGTPETNYGYWYPGKENDGGAGSAYVPQAYGGNWFGKQQPRGAWQYSGEIDLGFGAYLRSAAVIVTDDPIFGRIAYGGALTHSRGENVVHPEDGVGRRFHLLIGKLRVRLTLDRDGFAADKPIRFDDSLDRLTFTVENRDPQPAHPHAAQLSVAGLPSAYQVVADDKPLARLSADDGTIALPVGEHGATISLVRIH